MKNFVQTGDNLAILASLLVFPAHAAGDTYTNLVAPTLGVATPVNLPEAGDPVVCGDLVGVVNNDVLRSTDTAVISTRGVFNLSVSGVGSAGNAAVAVGQKVYIDPASAVINVNNTKKAFGIALAAVASGATAVIPVKLATF